MIISISVVTAKEFATIRASRASVSCARRFVSDSNVVFPSGNALFRRRIWSAEFPEVFKSSSFVFHVTENDRNFRAVNFYFRFFSFFCGQFSCQVHFLFRLAWNFFLRFFLTRTHRARPGFFLFVKLFFIFYLNFFSWLFQFSCQTSRDFSQRKGNRVKLFSFFLFKFFSWLFAFSCQAPRRFSQREEKRVKLFNSRKVIFYSFFFPYVW